ncbi:MAG: NosD domain-containing protein [Candidatus Hodarchaeota archaeon]
MNLEFLRKKKVFFIGLGLALILATSIGFYYVLFFKSDSCHSPISIESDEDFLNYDFIGNGTQDNPYIIQDFKICASGANSVGIYITNTNSFFIIKNCFIYTDYIGIRLYEVATGTARIINNTCISKTGDGGGIGLGNTINCTIMNNTCINFMQGIHLNYASHCLIMSNLIEDNNYQGINIRWSSFNIIINNTVKRSPQHGIALVGDADSNKIYHNIILNNSQLDTYDIDGRLTGPINSQAFDEGSSNFWYDNISKQGNWWSDYQGIGNYSIDGPASTEDIYPNNFI